MEIILDVGSGNTLKDMDTARRMVDEIKAIDTGKHTIIFKAQLFENQPPNVPLHRGIFGYLYEYANEQGYKCTASVFDKESLNYLLRFEVPFIKIACRPELYWLIGEIPRKIKVYVSGTNQQAEAYFHPDTKIIGMFCVPKYPALFSEYDQYLTDIEEYAISDHSPGIELIKKHHNTISIWEKHLKLPESIGPDAGSFAITPKELRSIL